VFGSAFVYFEEQILLSNSFVIKRYAALQTNTAFSTIAE
jgi:hypothetical protein